MGHTLWSASALETVVALLQLQAGKIHGTVNLDHPDDALDWDLCAGGSRALEARIVLKNAFGFGGYNTALVLERGEL